MAEHPERAAQLRGLSQADLMAKLDHLRQERWQQRVKVTEGAQLHTHRLREARRQIARIRTVLREQERARPSSGRPT